MAREPTLRERALRLLARREHSRAELAQKLAPHASPEDELESLLDEFARRNLLSESRYAETRAHKLARKYGAARIVRELRAKGVPDEVVAQAATAARATEIERARGIWQRKFRSAPASREERAKQMRFLQSRGFSFETIRIVLSGTNED